MTSHDKASIQEYEEEWYLWVDIDTVIIDVSFKLPFERFEGKDFITWGNSSRILAGDPLNGGILALATDDLCSQEMCYSLPLMHSMDVSVNQQGILCNSNPGTVNVKTCFELMQWSTSVTRILYLLESESPVNGNYKS